MMSIQVKLVLWLVSVASVFLVLYGAYHYGRHVEHLDNIAVQAKVNAAYEAKLALGVTQHGKNQEALAALRPVVKRVYVRIPTGDCAKTGDPDGAGGVLQQRTDLAFEHFREGVTALIERCDQLNIDAIEANSTD